MIWGFPAAFFFAAIGVPIAAVFFYRRWSRVVEVPAAQFWMSLGTPVNTRSISSLLRRILTLLLQILLAAFLVVALADPAPNRPADQRVLIVIDASATMQTKETGSRTRFDRAREIVSRAIDEMPSGAETAIIAAGDTPRMIIRLTRDRKAAMAELEKTTALDVDGDLAQAVRTASSLSDARMPCRVVVVSDFAAADPGTLRNAWRSPSTLTLVPVGRDEPDAAITDLWSEADRAGARIGVAVGQRGLDGRAVTISIESNGVRVATQSLMLDAPTKRLELATNLAPGVAFQARLEPADALPVDDAAFGVVPTPDLVKVLLVTAGNMPLEQALRAMPTVDLRVIEPSSFGGPGSAEVVVFDGPGTPAQQAVGAAGYLFVGTDPFGWARESGWSAAPRVTSWADGHPVMEDIDPTTFKIGQVLKLDNAVTTRVASLVDAGGVPIIAELSRGQESQPARRAIYWLFDLRATNLPRRLGFPVMLANAIDYLATRAREPETLWRRTGQPLQLKNAEGGATYRVQGVRDESLEVRPVSGGQAVFETSRQGIYRVSAGKDARPYAFNLVSSRGTRLLPKPEAGGQKSDDQKDAGTVLAQLGPFGRLSWQAALAVAAFTGFVEWILFHRRIVRIS